MTLDMISSIKNVSNVRFALAPSLFSLSLSLARSFALCYVAAESLKNSFLYRIRNGVPLILLSSMCRAIFTREQFSPSLSFYPGD